MRSIRPYRKVVVLAVLVTLSTSLCLFWRTLGIMSEKSERVSMSKVEDWKNCSVSLSDKSSDPMFNPDYQDTFDELQFFKELEVSYRSLAFGGGTMVSDDNDHVHRIPQTCSTIPIESFVAVPRYWLELASIVHKSLDFLPRTHVPKSKHPWYSDSNTPALEREYLSWLVDKMHRSSSHLVLCFDADR